MEVFIPLGSCLGDRARAGPLYDRAAYGKPQRLTTHGQALLDALDRRETAAALNDAAGTAPGPPDPGTLERLRAVLSTRAPARPLAAYPGLDVTPLRRTSHLLAVVGYLLVHRDRDVWGFTIAADVGLGHGTVYLLLQRLHRADWITAHVETEAQWASRGPHVRGQRRRRYHHLTPEGARAAEHIRT